MGDIRKAQLLKWLDNNNKAIMFVTFALIVICLLFEGKPISSQTVNIAYVLILVASFVFMVKKIFFNIPAETIQLKLPHYKWLSILHLGLVGGFLMLYDFMQMDYSTKPLGLISEVFFLPVVVFLVMSIFDFMTFDKAKFEPKETWLSRKLSFLKRYKLFKKGKNGLGYVLAYIRIFIHLVDTMLIVNIVYFFPKIQQYITTTSALVTVLMFSIVSIASMTYIRDYILAFGIRNYQIQKLLFKRKNE